MMKKHLIALAQLVQHCKPDCPTDGSAEQIHKGRMQQWQLMRDRLADFCQQQNARFNRERWLGYITGECGPNGGAL